MDTASPEIIINFLSTLYDGGMSYSAIKIAKAALSYKINLPFCHNIGDHPLIRKFMKGIFNLRPPKAKSAFIWDVKILFNHFEDMSDNKELSDRDLSHKTLALLLLLHGTRLNTMIHLRIDEMIMSEVGVTFTPSALLKHSRPNSKSDSFEYKAYHDKKLCIIDCLKVYLNRRTDRVDQEVKQLFITYKKPYKAASIDTLRRWVKNIFQEANIHDFSPHSCRAASTSKANMLNLDINEILKRASWANAKTFYRFYNKQIIPYNVNELQDIILE